MKSKKFISMLLCVVLIAWQIPAMVFAEGEGEDAGLAPDAVVSEEVDNGQEEQEPQIPEEPEEEIEEEIEETDEADLYMDEPEVLSGSGTEEDPYIIDSDGDWELFVTMINNAGYGDRFYKLTSDINIKTSVGISGHAFKGTFDGGGHTIVADLEGNTYVAPFAYVQGGYIKNLNVTGHISATGKYASGLVGQVKRITLATARGCEITNCTVSAVIESSVSGDGTHGGFIGFAEEMYSEYSQTISYSYLGCTIKIFNSCFNGQLLGSSTNRCGGFIGWVTAKSDVYFEGDFFNPSGITISTDNCGTFARAADNSKLHFTGSNYYTRTLGTAQGQVCYEQAPADDLTKKITLWNADYYVTGSASLTVAGAPYTTTGSAVEVTPVVTFDGVTIDPSCYTVEIRNSDDEKVAEVTEAGDYTLIITGVDAKDYYGSLSAPFKVLNTLDGSGTVSDPYIIHNADDWEIMALNVNSGFNTDKYYKLADDYDDSTAVTMPAGTSDHPFEGVFDGNGKIMTVDITDTSAQGAAPFRYIADATIKDLKVTGSVTGTTHAAGLVGFILSGESTVTDCTVSVNVSGGSHIGGIVGHGGDAVLNMTNCIYDGTLVKATDKAAGIVGWMNGATINLTNCLFAGTDSTGKQFHPIALKNGSSSVTKTITDCYYLTDPTITSGDNVLGPTIGLKVSTTAPSCIYRMVTAADNEQYYASSAEIRGLIKDYYSSTELELPYTVGLEGLDPLVEGEDYEVSYTKDGSAVGSVTGPGSYVITATAKGSYSGSCSYEFTVHDTVTYKDYDETTGKFVTKEAPATITRITSSTTRLNKEWYIVDGNITVSSRIRVSGTVRIILKDGSRLTADYGMSVQRDRNLFIYGQEDGTGELICYARNYGDSALGAENNNNSSTSQGDENNNHQTYGHITINGGRVTADAVSQSAYLDTYSGIGAGRWEWGFGGGNYGQVTINGGTVVAKGKSGAGIGGAKGSHSGTITIRGGNVTATSSSGDGIGNGPECISAATVNLTWDSADSGMTVCAGSYGGTVKLLKPFQADGTGYRGNLSDADKNAIRNKNLVPYAHFTVTYKASADAITSLVYTVDAGECTLSNGLEFDAPEGKELVGWTVGNDTATVYPAGSKYVLKDDVTFIGVWSTPEVAYVDADGNDMDPKECYPINVGTITELDGSSSTSGWYAVTRDVTVNSRINVTGDVNIILVDGVTLTAPKGISVTDDGSLTIWGQTEGTGKILINSVDTYNAGIGGVYDTGEYKSIPCGAITINGGTIDVRGGQNAAGIGGSYQCDDSAVITINGGTVTAASGNGGAGIGGSYEGQTGKIFITGGTVTASGSDGAGIGSGFRSHDHDGDAAVITITGGTVTASTSSMFANKARSIGGGGESGNCFITISGGAGTAPNGIGDGLDYPTNKPKSVVRLDWDPSDPDLSVTSLSYTGVIMLIRPFMDVDGGTVYKINGSADASQLAGKTLVPYNEVYVAGHSLTLDGTIGVDYYVYVPEGRTPGTMSFEITGRGSVDAKAGYKKESGYYVYTCYVTSVQMADEITATYSDNDGGYLTDIYSVKAYIDYIEEHQNDYDEKTVDLVRALADYGHYVQPFLKAQNGWTFNTDDGYAEMTVYYKSSFDYASIRNALQDVSVSASVTGTEITGASYALRLDSDMELDVFLKSSGDIELQGYQVKELSDGRYQVRFSNIAASDLDKEVTVTGNAGGEFSITLSPLCYIKTVLNSDDYGADAKNAMAAAYNYYAASQAYIAG